MGDAAFYRQQAEKARRLAARATDPVARAQLLAFAEEYKAEAQAADIASRLPTASDATTN